MKNTGNPCVGLLRNFVERLALSESWSVKIKRQDNVNCIYVKTDNKKIMEITKKNVNENK